MRICKHKKKGMTLIEAIISVALLSILIVPISGLVMTSVNTNKRAEIKQEAAFLGQKLLEEMKVYDKIKLVSNGNFQLLNGQGIKRVNTDESAADFNNFNGKFSIDKYAVEIKLIKDDEFTYEDISKDPLENIVFDYKLEFKGDASKTVTLYKNTESGLSEVSSYYPIVNNNLNLKIGNGIFILLNNEIEMINDSGVPISNNNNILIDLNDNFTGNIKLDFYNQTDIEKNIYIKKNSSTTGKVEVNSYIGKIKIFNNIISSTKNTLGDLYNVEVTVSNRGNTLFNGIVSQNIWIQ